MMILVCGGRDFDDWPYMEAIFQEYDRQVPVILHGAARGADMMAGSLALVHGWRQIAMPANWEKHGKAAGHIRNGEMLDLQPELVIAFPGGKGTANCVNQAEGRGISVRDLR